MRYLLDELMAYEEGFSDIMMPDRSSDRHETFMGLQDPAATVSKQDLANLRTGIREEFQGLLHNFFLARKSSSSTAPSLISNGLLIISVHIGVC